MKRVICLVLILMLLITGCSTIKERKNSYDYENLETIDIEYQKNTSSLIKPALYFVQKGTGKLTAELHTIVIEANENPVKKIIQELLVGPNDPALASIAPAGVIVEYVEVSVDVANVYLYSRNPINPKDGFLIKIAVANTLIDYLNIEYTHIFINGKSQGINIYPNPIQKMTTGIWTEEYDKEIGKFVSMSAVEDQKTTITLEVPLYFFDTSSEYIIPEVREIVFEDDNYAIHLIEELAKGPKNSYVYLPSVSKQLKLLQLPNIEIVDDQEILMLNLSQSPTLSHFESKEDDIKSYVCLVYTLAGFYPNINKIILDIDGVRVSNIGREIDISQGVEMEQLQGYLADSISLYFRIKDTNLLNKVNRMIYQDSIWNADIRLHELIKGPKINEGADIWPCFPKGITSEDILGTKTFGSTMEVNLSQNFKDRCKDMTAEQEMLMVFSMVNTLTDMQGIMSVQFLVQGEKTDALAGHLYFGDLFMNNPGLVKIGD